MAGKGAVGWDVYRDLYQLAALRPGAQTRQFSSFDRTGGNDDGFAGTYSYLRTDTDGYVLAERLGPGQIESIWFTRDYGSLGRTGRIIIELDGVRMLNAPLQDVVDGRLGPPYVWPLVGNGDDTAGGGVIRVPMPYRESMRVITQHNPFFYHVTYREFADADGVSTFNPAEDISDVLDVLRHYGVRDPKPPRAQRVESGPGVTCEGSGWVTQLRVWLPHVRSPRVGAHGRAFGKGGRSTFRLTLDPANEGARITRRYDPGIGEQCARLVVDGREAGLWQCGPSVPSGQWADQTIELPAELTAGKAGLVISNEFISSTLDVNEFTFSLHSKVNGDWLRTDVLDVGTGHPGCERAHEYKITKQTWQGYRVFRYPVDPLRLRQSQAMLDRTRLLLSFDDQSTVEAPVGEFFGSGMGAFDTRSLLFALEPEGWFTCWWPMPFAESVTASLVGEGDLPVDGGLIEVSTVDDPAVADLLVRNEIGHFHATHRDARTVNGTDYVFLQTGGRGSCCGLTHTMHGEIPSGNMRNYLEGDERVYVDGAGSPTWHGTGTEDFYESGWYFRDGTTYAMPLAGNPAYQAGEDGCPFDCTGAFRVLLGDAISFCADLRFGIEHGPTNNEPARYTSTTYWYGRDSVCLVETDVLDLAEEAGRAEHDYRAGGESREVLESAFEGEHTELISHGTTLAAGMIWFTVTTTEENAGVRLLRLSDQQRGYQQASVFVDDQFAGIWLQPLGNPHARWLEDTFELPAALTEGKSSLAIRLEPTLGAPAWSAARYRVLTKVGG